MKRADKIILYRNGSLAVLFVGALTFISIYYAPFLKEMFSSTDALREYVLAYGNFGIAVFMGFQMLHIFIPVIPGEVVQIAGGYIFGTVPASAYLMSGTMLGTIAVFYIARWIGYPLVQIFVKPATLRKMKKVMNGQKAEIVLFLLMLIPGFPKDTLVYVAGLSPMSAWRFFLISFFGRMPCLVGSAYIGSNIHSRDYVTVIIMAVITFAAIGVGIYFRKHPIFHLHHHDDHEPAVETDLAD